MMKKGCDLHTHTNFSDGTASVAEMARAAADMGLETLGISEHSPMPWPNDWAIDEARYPQWNDEIDKVRAEMDGRLTLLRGIELDWCSTIGTDGFDYVIGSTHELMLGADKSVHRSVDESEKTMLRTVREFFHGDFYAYTKFYYETLTRWCTRPVIDILGHVDIVAKFNEGGKWFDENDPRYLRSAEDAIDALCSAGFIFEMNSGAVSRGYRITPYPALPLLRMILDRGGHILLSSDAHAPENIAYQFDEMAALLQSCGFSGRMVWKNGEFEEAGW